MAAASGTSSATVDASGSAEPGTIDDGPPLRIPLVVKGGTFLPSPATKALLGDIGGPPKLHAVCTRFYELAFKDRVLRRFMFDNDGAEAHGLRLSDWIAEKMGEPGMRWTRTRPPHSRQRSHWRAWNSPHREEHKRGDHFKLDDCRVWMRIMFLSAREQGLHDHPVFWDWYVRFIGHFVRVYERSAPLFAAESAAWSADSKVVDEYVRDGWKMRDILGLGLHEAAAALESG